MPLRKHLFVFALTLVCTAVALAQSADHVKFTFDLPDGLTWVETQKTSRTATGVGVAGAQTRESQSAAKYVVKKSGEGYEVSTSMLNASSLRNGQAVPDPLTESLKGISFKYKIAKSGEFVSMEGVEAAIAAISKSVPAEALPIVQKLMTAESLTARARNDWNSRIPRFLTLSGEIGDTWASTDSAPLLTGGEVTFYTVTKLDSRIPCGTKRCVKITISYNTDPNELSKSFGEGIGKLLKDTPVAETKVSDARVVGEGEFIVDSATTLVQSEKLKRTMEMTIASQSGPVRVTVNEVRESSFEYSK